MCNFDESFWISENEKYNLVTIVQIAAHIACGIQQLAKFDAIFSIYESCHTVQPKKAMNIWICFAFAWALLFIYQASDNITVASLLFVFIAVCDDETHKKKRGKKREIYQNNKNVYAHTHTFTRRSEQTKPANQPIHKIE